MLKELRSQHRNIIQMSFNGFKNNEIAEKLGLAPATISQILRSPLGQAYLNGLTDKSQEDTLDVRKKLISLNKDALNTITRILDPKIKAPFNVQLTAAKDVLDRNGYKPSDKFEIDVYSHKSDDEIENEIRAMEAAVARSQITQGNADTEEESHDEEPQEVSSFPLDINPTDADAAASINSKLTEATALINPALDQNLTSDQNSAPDQNLPSDLNPNQKPRSSYNPPTNHNVLAKHEAMLPPDIRSKLADANFDPFKNIDW